MSSLSVEALLGPGGALSGVLAAYEHRPEQLRMAQAVERAIQGRRYLLAEAGTGTGKTLAYLIPAVLSGRKVVVSTATKTLQEQIFFKDIPLLRGQVGLEFSAAYLKGRSNYLCLQRFEQFDKEPRFATREESELWPGLRDWALRTQSGDRSEAELPDHFSAWPKLSTTSDSCLSSRCPLFEPCFVTQNRRRAEDAELVVVNHHLFFADLALRTRAGRALDGILPRYDLVIFDEAHALEDVASEYFGSQVSSWRLDELAVDAMEALPPSEGRGGTLAALAVGLRARTEGFLREAPRALGLSLRDASIRLSSKSFARVNDRVDEVIRALQALGSFTADAEEPPVAALARRSTELAEELDFIRRAESLDHVYWAEARGKGLFLRSAPIDVAQELRRRLYPGLDTIVFTSATLRAQGRFDFFAGRMGLSAPPGRQEGGGELSYERDDPRAAPAGEPAYEAVAVESPFDYPTQAALYLPKGLPEPNAPGFIEAAAEQIVALASITGGRAFALFTSLRNMEAAHALVRDRLDCQVLLQGERPKSALLEAFRATPSVLFAAHSFWEGVDVPGEALSLVIIDRLPFGSPADPRLSARIDQLRARGEDPFASYQLPEAAIALRQGFGRLIRSRQDRGIMALLDARISTKAYGRGFLASLPKARRIVDLELLRRWFQGGGARSVG